MEHLFNGPRIGITMKIKVLSFKDGEDVSEEKEIPDDAFKIPEDPRIAARAIIAKHAERVAKLSKKSPMDEFVAAIAVILAQ